jgi:indole-3-pyruvate monooxygenase
LTRLLFGNITQLGLQRKRYGPFEEIQKDKTIPVLDIGTVKHIRKGHITIYTGIDHIEGNAVHFTNGKQANVNAIIAAIGYDTSCTAITDVDQSRFEDLKSKISKQQYFGKDGLYGCGFWIGPTGHIREIASDAQLIANDIAERVHSS